MPPLEECFGTVGHELLASPINDEESGRSASQPASFGGTGFQPVHRTGKMPVPPKTFQGRAVKAPISPIIFRKALPPGANYGYFD
jgi:hypothetical protein